MPPVGFEPTILVSERGFINLRKVKLFLPLKYEKDLICLFFLATSNNFPFVFICTLLF
jgi:hypothetical protein